MTRKIVLERQNQRGSVSIVSLLFLERQGRVVIFLKRFGKTDLEHVFQYYFTKSLKNKKRKRQRSCKWKNDEEERGGWGEEEKRDDEVQEACKQERVIKTHGRRQRWSQKCATTSKNGNLEITLLNTLAVPSQTGYYYFSWALGMVSSCGAVFLNYFRKTDIAKNVVLRGELVSFPYGAKAVYRSSVVFLNCL